MKYNAHNIVQAGHAKMRKKAEAKKSLAQRKREGPSGKPSKLKLKREIKKEINRLIELYESL